MTGLLPLKRRTMSAVFGPTPRNCLRMFLASSMLSERIGLRSPRYFSRVVFAACFIASALFFWRPAGLMHCSIWSVLVFVSASGFILYLFESCSKAFEAFLLVVFCEIIVATRVLNGSSEDLAHVGIGKVFFSFRRML